MRSFDFEFYLKVVILVGVSRIVTDGDVCVCVCVCIFFSRIKLIWFFFIKCLAKTYESSVYYWTLNGWSQNECLCSGSKKKNNKIIKNILKQFRKLNKQSVFTKLYTQCKHWDEVTSNYLGSSVLLDPNFSSFST